MEQAFTDSECAGLASVGDAFDFAFKCLMARENRDEYVYKSAITQRILLGRHSLRSACMLNEFRVGQCKADLVFFLSERDDLARLSPQLASYKAVFPIRYVVAGEQHIDSILRTVDVDVGILSLSSRHRISTVRAAQERVDLVDTGILFDSIRVDEAINILKCRNIEIPDVPNTRIRRELREVFCAVAAQDIYPTFVSVLKRSRSLASLEDLVGGLPVSLRAAALTIRSKPSDHKNLLAAINSNLKDALGWS
ncbi:sce7726 family protein [Achromobacter ruhlandii]|uniref:sce7726 family protein n=1 Tax=Achromobacter ruhlandii TaxID=72557 RepID=UPI0018E247F8|nr:sce7726 family protein [Achromobacter ruhlandii]